MASGTRSAGIASLVGAVAAAVALAGVAVFTVQQAACADTGHYVQRGGQIELVGGCVGPEDLSPAPAAPGTDPGSDAGAGVDRFRQVSP